MTVFHGTAYWTAIAAPATGGKYPSGQYEITLGNLDDATIANIKGMGMGKYLKDYSNDEKMSKQGMTIKLRGGFDKNDKPVRPSLISESKEDYPVNTLVGNGSKVKCLVKMYSTKNGSFFTLQSIMVDTLVPYEGGVDLSEFDEAVKELDPYAIAS